MKTLVALLVLTVTASGALAQQYRNFEATPDRRGGVQGTWGKRNFEIDNYSRGNPSGHVGGRQPGRLSEKPSVTPGNRGATQSRCYVDGYGRSVCQ